MNGGSQTIELDQGGGGQKSADLISHIRKALPTINTWTNTEDDGAVFNLGATSLVFTTDGFIVEPIFFPGGDIGKIAMCGTINDLCMMGAEPIGVALSIIMEEGFPIGDLEKIIASIAEISRITGVPIVTGDTKVTEKGKLDKIEITTSGVGLVKKIISNSGAQVGDVLIASGNLGEHAVALLAKRFDYRTSIISDCRPLIDEIKSVRAYLSSAKDPTRGGAAAVLNEMADKSGTKFVLTENLLPFGRETIALSELLGIDKFTLPSEGRFLATVPEKYLTRTLLELKKFNLDATAIGRVEAGSGVYLENQFGSEKKIESPRGKLIPRIC